MSYQTKDSSDSTSTTIPLLPSSSSSTSQLLLSSNPKSFANVFISIVGAGVLGLPYTFKRTGYLSGVLLLSSVSLLTFHSLHLLVLTRRRLSSKPSSYPHLAFSAAGPNARLAVDVLLLLTHSSFSVSYLVFISRTLPFPSFICIAAMLPFQLALNSVKTLTRLAPLSIFADVVNVVAMTVVMVKEVGLVVEPSHVMPTKAVDGDVSVLFYGLGVAVYCFEGVGLILPLESEAADKPKFGCILGLAMFIITVIYATFGVLGYWAFGDDTADVITRNLSQGVVMRIIQVGLCVNLFVSFPLMMNPVYEIVERRFGDEGFCLWKRWLVVFAVVSVALFVPSFTDFLSLVGSSVCSVLGLVLPGIFHIKVFKEEMGLGWLALDVFVVVIGVFIAVTGTYTSLVQIISPTK